MVPDPPWLMRKSVPYRRWPERPIFLCPRFSRMSMLFLLFRAELVRRLNLQGRLHVAHCERVIGHVLPKFSLVHRRRFLIPDGTRNLPRRIRTAIDRDSQHDKFAMSERSAMPSMFESFYYTSLCGTDGHVAARIALTIFEWEVGLCANALLLWFLVVLRLIQAIGKSYKPARAVPINFESIRFEIARFDVALHRHERLAKIKFRCDRCCRPSIGIGVAQPRRHWRLSFHIGLFSPNRLRTTASLFSSLHPS